MELLEAAGHKIKRPTFLSQQLRRKIRCRVQPITTHIYMLLAEKDGARGWFWKYDFLLSLDYDTLRVTQKLSFQSTAFLDIGRGVL